MFFPKLTRRCEEEYHNRNGEFYSDYKKNYIKVAEDCAHRCVYCDITSEEFGGDEMQLDHFRPQKFFEHLKRHPHNLYLSCPKCNVLKTSDWPVSKVDDAPSFDGEIGYLDRFSHDADEYLRVSEEGRILQIDGPVNYMIRQMHLNRPSRVNVRRRRLLRDRKTKLLKAVLCLLKEASSNAGLSRAEKDAKVSAATSLMEKIVAIPL